MVIFFTKYMLLIMEDLDSHEWHICDIRITPNVMYEGQRGAGFMIFLWQTLYSRTTFDPYYILGTSTCSVFSVKTQWNIKSEKSTI